VVGTASITVRECLTLQPRSVVRLSQVSGSDLDLSVRGVSIASGEVLIVDESTAIRVVRITPSSDSEPPV
jgi:flagellar motor switch/type III secretory pathway protein FliN